MYFWLYGIIPLISPYLNSTCMCTGKGVLTRRVSEAFFIVMDPGGYGGEKRNVIICLGNPGYSFRGYLSFDGSEKL